MRRVSGKRIIDYGNNVTNKPSLSSQPWGVILTLGPNLQSL